MHVNALNSTTMETSYSGCVSSDVLVYPWGDMGKNPVQSAYQFAGTIWMDGYSSADFAAYRLYRYDQGRWLTPDPLGGDVTNPQSLNRYAYVLNNPASLTDPLGLSGCRFGAHSIGPGQCEDDIPGGGIHWPVMWLMDLFQMMSQTECYYEKNCVNFTMWGGMTFASLLASSAAANNGDNCSVSASSLDNYLSTKNSPMVGEGANLMSSGTKYNIDPRLFVSLAGAETGFGNNITAGRFNAFNVLYNGLNSPFASFQSAINSVGHSLTNPRNGYDFANTATLYGHYCSGAGCSAGLKNVNIFMNQQGAKTNSLHYPCKKE